MLLSVFIFLPLQREELGVELIDLGVESLNLGAQFGDLVTHVTVRRFEDVVQPLNLELQPLPIFFTVSVGLFEIRYLDHGLLQTLLGFLESLAELILHITALR